MKDEEKTAEQLRDKLTEMRERLAELEAAATERTQAEERLRQERDFSSILIHASPVFFVAIGADGKTLMMNETMLSALGYRTDEVVGADYLTRFVPEGDRESLSQIFKKLTRSSVPTTNENHVLTKDGRELLVEWHGRPVFTEGGEFDFFFGAGIDITERKTAQLRIEHLNLVLRAIRNVNQLIVAEKDRDRLLQGVCDSLIETRGYHTAWIGLFDEEKTLVPIAQAGWNEESAVPITDLQHGWSPVCAQRILAEPEVQVIESPHSTCGDCSLSGTHRDRGVLAVRLEHAGKVYGMLAASIPVGLISDDEEHALLAEVAADIAFALYSIELEAERKRTEKALNLKLKQLDALSSASHAVSASLDPKQVLERIVSLAREAVGADYTSVMLVDRASDTVRSAEDFSGVPSIEYRIRTKGLTSLIMDRGAAVIIDEIGEDGTITPDLGAGAPRLINPHIMKANTKSVAGLPLTGKDRSLGVLYLHSLQPWAFHDQETLLTTFANQAAIAVENARLYERVSQELAERTKAEDSLRESERRLRIMTSVLAELSQSKRPVSGDLNAYLKEITEAAARTLEVERVSVWLYNEEGSKIHCVDRYEPGSRRHSTGPELTAADNPAYFRALEEGRAIVVDDARTDPRTKDFSETYISPHGITAMLDAPIRLGGRIIGIIAHEHVGPARRWTFDEQNFAGSLADFISLTMEAQERQRAEAALAESERKIESLHKIARRLAACKTADKIYRLTVEAAERILEFSLCSLDIVEEDSLVVKATSSEVPPEGSVGRPLAEGGLAAKTYRTGETIAFGSLDEVPEATPTSADFKSGISALIGDIGVFQVVSTQAGAFTKDDVRRLELLLGHTAEAIKRIHLQDELREQAIRDPLTGVYNRRYFTQTLEQEIARSTRYDRPIAFLMIDINRFKEINDRFGHQVGDRVLQEVGELLQEQVRESDTVVRYGGDEFLVVLPETNGETEVVKERIDAEVAQRNKTNEIIDFPVTLAIGSAYWTPGRDESVHEILAKADSRMYEAKRAQKTGDQTE